MTVARHERERLICHYGRMNRLELYAGEKTITRPAQRSIEGALRLRKKGVPLSYITGAAPFYGRDFIVTPDVLIPRPETERLLEETLAVIDRCYAGQSAAVLDLGTGSGCLAASLTLERPDCRMTALDASAKALRVARKNFKLFGLGQKIRSRQSRLFGAFKGRKALWDIIVTNPPYIPKKDLAGLPREVRHEPVLALDGGERGLELIDAILDQAPLYLAPSGWLLVEIGAGQAKILAKRKRAAFASLRFEKDLNGIERILIARAHG